MPGVAGSGGFEALVAMVRELSDEPTPEPMPPVDLSAFGSRGSPMDQAGRGFGLAVQATDAAFYAVRMGAWRERQQLAQVWLADLDNQGPGGEFAELRARLEKLNGDRLEQATVMARRLTVISEGFRQIRVVIGRTRDRLVEVMGKARKRIEQVPPENVERQKALVSGVQHEAIIISEIGVKRINTQTRRVLDLDESTASVSVTEWLARHGLDVSSPPPDDLGPLR